MGNGTGLRDRTVLKHFTPHDMQSFREALELAWTNLRPIANADGTAEGVIKQLLAEGIVRAANLGERSVPNLSRAACAYWFVAISPTPNLESATVQ